MPFKKRSYKLTLNGDGTVTVPLSQELSCRISIRHIAKVASHSWFAHRHPNGAFYAMRGQRVNGKQTMIYMHRMLLGITDPTILVDHRDGDTLNNTQSNIRRATPSQNMYNTRLQRNPSGYRGVYLHKPSGLYMAYINHDGKRIHLGYFACPKTASEARDKAASELHQEFARLNCDSRDEVDFHANS